jgi:mannose-1-phosphate guanylyltransferase
MATDDYWLDTGRPELYLDANLDVVAGRRRFDHCDAVHPTASVAADAVVVESVVGAGCAVGAGAVLERSVLLPGAVVGAGARVVASVVMGTVGEGASLQAVVLGSEALVADGEHLNDCRRPEPA